MVGDEVGVVVRELALDRLIGQVARVAAIELGQDDPPLRVRLAVLLGVALVTVACATGPLLGLPPEGGADARANVRRALKHAAGELSCAPKATGERGATLQTFPTLRCHRGRQMRR